MLQETVLTAPEVEQLQRWVENARKVVVTCHVGPDGDAVGSMSAMVQLMSAIGKEAVGIVPNNFPDNLKFVPGAGQFVVAENAPDVAKRLVAEADLLFCLDYNGLQRTGEVLGKLLQESASPRVMIDHHLEPMAEEFSLLVSQPQMSSTCEVLLHVVNDMGWMPQLGADIATALYTGLLTDTGAFSYACNRGEVFRATAILLDRGIDKDRIYRNIYWGASEGRMRMMGYLLYVNMQVLKKWHTSIITLTNDEYRRMHLKNGDTEGFVNLPLQIEGIRLSIFLREDTEVPGKIKVSTRSVDDVPCNLIAQEFFNGGGHKNAAGGSLMCTLEQAVEIARKAVQKFADKIAEQPAKK